MAIKKRKTKKKVGAKGRARVSKGRATVAAKRTARPARKPMRKTARAAARPTPPSRPGGKRP